MSQQKSSPCPITLVLLLSGVFFLCFLVVSGVLFLSSRSPLGSKAGGASSSSSSSLLFSFSVNSGAVGVVELTGIIMDSKRILAQLDSFDEDEQIKAVVLRVNSPGGVVAPAQEIYEAVKSYKKPLVVSMNALAASGAYYIAVGAKKIFANPGTLTGSIGVIMEFVNLEKFYEWAKIHRYVIKSGRHKDIGAEFRDLTPEEREILQKTSDDILDQFKGAVAEGRQLSPEQVTEVATGQIFSGRQAKALHLVDELGTITDAINEAGKLGGMKDKPRVVYAEKRKKSILDYLMLDDDSNNGADSGFSGGLMRSLMGGLTGAVADRIIHRLVGGSSGVSRTGGAPTGTFGSPARAGTPLFGGGDLPPGIYVIWQGGRSF